MLRELAGEWVWNGEYDQVIRERISQGDFDEEVLKRAEIVANAANEAS